MARDRRLNASALNTKILGFTINILIYGLSVELAY